MASDPIGRMLAQLDRDILARGSNRATVCEKAGLTRGTITKWNLKHKRSPTIRGFRSTNWARIQKALAEMPLIEPLPASAQLPLQPPEVQPSDVAANHIFDDTHDAMPAPSIKERLEKLEQMVVSGEAAFQLLPGGSVPYTDAEGNKQICIGRSVPPKTQGQGDDALRDVILDRLLAMDTVKLANLFAYIVNHLK